jgi:hypothetical protein
MKASAFLILLLIPYAFSANLEELISSLKEQASEIACETAYKAITGVQVGNIDIKFDITNVGFFEGIKRIWNENLFEKCRWKLTFAFIGEKFKSYFSQIRETLSFYKKALNESQQK